MKKSLFPTVVFAFSLVFSGYAHAITPDKAEFRKLADDVYVYIGKLNDANAMVVVTSQGVVVIITQNHGDHIGGTPLFSPPATVILHDR